MTERSHINVGATLTLTGSKIRRNPNPQPKAADLPAVPTRRSISITTSTAQNDAGVFEFSFRDERYMPFEGAGAVESSWNLSLPKNFRPFDYQTISDVILRIAYTAEYDGAFRQQVEGNNEQIEGEILKFLKDKELARVFSLRQDFPTEFQRLLSRPLDSDVEIEISEKYLPLFLAGRWESIQPQTAKLVLRTAKKEDGRDYNLTNIRIAMRTSGVQSAPGDVPQSGFSSDSTLGGLPAQDYKDQFGNRFVGKRILTIRDAGDLAPSQRQPDTRVIDGEKLLDILLVVTYKLGA